MDVPAWLRADHLDGIAHAPETPGGHRLARDIPRYPMALTSFMATPSDPATLILPRV